MNIEKTPLKALGLLGLLTVLVAQYYYFGTDHDEPVGDNSFSTDEKQGAKIAVDSSASSKEEAASLETSNKRIEVRRLESQEKRKQLIESIQMATKLREMWKSSGLSEDDVEHESQNKRGSLSRETIRAAVGAVIEDVKTCYDLQLETTPKLWGKLVVDFVIVAEEGIGGVVDSVELGEGTDLPMRESRELVDCIVETIYTLELPEPEGGGQVEVSYPLIMRPGGD